jgi:hypothetical protein
MLDRSPATWTLGIHHVSTPNRDSPTIGPAGEYNPLQVKWWDSLSLENTSRLGGGLEDDLVAEFLQSADQRMFQVLSMEAVIVVGAEALVCLPLDQHVPDRLEQAVGNRHQRPFLAAMPGEFAVLRSAVTVLGARGGPGDLVMSKNSIVLKTQGIDLPGPNGVKTTLSADSRAM